MIMTPKVVSLRHTSRGSWLARAEGQSARDLLGEELIAVLRYRGNEDFDPTIGRYHETVSTSFAVPEKNWWMLPRHKAWRERLRPRAFVALRRYAADGTSSGGTGKWLGVYLIENAIIDVEQIDIRLDPVRIAEVRP